MIDPASALLVVPWVHDDQAASRGAGELRRQARRLEVGVGVGGQAVPVPARVRGVLSNHDATGRAAMAAVPVAEVWFAATLARRPLTA